MPRKTLPAKDRRPGEGSIAAPFLLFACLLLAVLIVDVTWLMPQRTREEQQYWVPNHQRLKNSITAERMISSLLPSPATRWAGQVNCREVGQGVWYAEGLVGQYSDAGREVPTAWKVFFVPEDSQPIYAAVGDRQEGDFQAALRQAGVNQAKP